MAAIVNFGPVERAKASWREKSFAVNSVDTRKNKNVLKSVLSRLDEGNEFKFTSVA